MRNLIASLIVAVVACSGCGKFYVPPIAPEYDVATCEMHPSDYSDMAALTTDIESVGPIPEDAAEALAYCTMIITSRGWVLVEKDGDGSSRLARFSTTGPTELPIVLLGVGFKDRPIESQAMTMCHEAVHTYQFDRLGTARMAATYIISEGAFSIEVPAYRMSLRVWAQQHPDASRGEVEAKATAIIENLYDKYELTNMPRRCAIELGVAILMLDH